MKTTKTKAAENAPRSASSSSTAGQWNSSASIKSPDDILTISLRPSRLSEVLGQKHLISALRRQMSTRRPRTLMFSGPTGCGKTTMAYIVAHSLQCCHQPLWGEPCDRCIDGEFAIHDINASGEAHGIEELGQVAELARYPPQPPSLKRVIILDEAQGMTPQAQRLLLKHTEKPPQHVTWIICTTEPSKLLPTLRRRFVQYPLRSLSLTSVEFLLKRLAYKTGFKEDTAPLAEVLHENQIASPALVLMAFEKLASGFSPQDAIAELAGGSEVNSLGICKAVGRADWLELRGLLARMTADEARWIRASVCGYLRAWLCKEDNPQKRLALALSLKELTEMAPLEDFLLHSWLVSVLYNVCRQLKRQ